MSRKASTTTSASTATIGFEAKLWLTADKLRRDLSVHFPTPTRFLNAA